MIDLQNFAAIRPPSPPTLVQLAARSSVARETYDVVRESAFIDPVTPRACAVL